MVANATVRRIARAKVNLYLHVRGLRPDGYHELDSLVVFPAFGDEVELRPADTFRLVVDGPFAPALAGLPPEQNLAMKAAILLLHEVDGAPDFEIRLRKNIPLGAGLGGGSADAAAVLLLLNQRLGLGLELAELRGLGLRLGADVPACLSEEGVYFAGVGEVIEPAPALPPLHLALVWPGRGLATAEVFRASRAGAARPRPSFTAAGLTKFVEVLRDAANDLETAARSLLPAVGEALDALSARRDCLLARMSGSGSACFGIFPSAEAAEAAAGDVRRTRPGWWAVSATA